MSLNPHDTEYLKLLQYILDKGVDKDDRTGVGTRSVFGYQMRFDLSQSFPLLTTKKVFMKGIIHELLWFLSGDTNITYLVRNGVGIWNEWAFQIYLEETGKDKELERYSDEWRDELKYFVKQIKEDDDFAKQWGELGPIYGKQWRKWETKHGEEIDQIQNVINDIKTKPHSRRHLISGWNIGEIDGLVKNQNRAPPPCHSLFQFYVSNGKLSCQLYQRSADVFLGVPFNIASYSLLTLMIAKITGLEPGEFIHTFGDVHIYSNHFDQVKEQLSREPMEPTAQIVIHGEQKSIDDFKFDDFEVKEYKSHPAIKAPIAV